MCETLKNKALKGILWNAVDRFSSQGISFLVSIMIARLLTPHDYGLVAMVGVFIAVAQTFVDSGFSSAIVRKVDRTEVDLSTAFYANVGIGILCYLILYLLAPYIACFYRESELCAIVRAMGVIFFLFSFSNIQQAVLTINVNFKTKTKISLISVIISGLIGMFLAFVGFGVWALVYQQVVFALSKVILLWAFVKWRPLRAFSWNSFSTLFSFGSKMLLAGLLNSVFSNLYSIVIGKSLSSSYLGYYSRAEQFAQFPSTSIANIIKGVSFPTMALIQNEEERFNTNFYRIQNVITFFSFPLIIGLAALSTPLIFVLLSEKWIYSARLLQIICFALMWYPVYSQNLNILEVKGFGNYILKSEIVSKTICVIALFFLIPMGLEAVCWGQVFSNLLSVLISGYFVAKVTKSSYKRLFDTIKVNFVFALVMGMVCYMAQIPFSLPIIQLGVGILVGIITYFILNYLFNRSSLVMFYRLVFKK